MFKDEYFNQKAGCDSTVQGRPFVRDGGALDFDDCNPRERMQKVKIQELENGEQVARVSQ